MKCLNISFRMSRKVFAGVIAAVVSFAASAKEDGWSIRVEEPGSDGYAGAAVANGVLSLVSSPELFTCSNSMLADTWSRRDADDVQRLLDGYNLLNGRMTIDGTTLSRENVRGFVQTLDLRESMMKCSFTMPGKAEVKYDYVPLGGMPHVALLTVKVKALSDIDMTFENIRTAPADFENISTTFPEYHRRSVPCVESSSLARSRTGETELGVASMFLFEKDEAPATEHAERGDTAVLSFRKHIAKGKSFTFALAAAEYNSAQHSLPLTEAQRVVAQAKFTGIDRLLRNHRAYWDKMWRGDIEIDGPVRDQQDIRYMIYSIYSAVRPGTAASPSPFGLSSGGYSGHVFWDTELWMFPPMLVLNPEVARAMLDYRYERLGAARKYAQASGMKGARFPWESAYTGDEQTPATAHTGFQEIHITACVAIAAWNYYLVTGDREWLRTRGLPLITEGADFWVSRATRGEDGKYHIENVCGADEYAGNVDDNAFTNGAAKRNLEIAAAAMEACGQSADPAWKEVADGLAFTTDKDGVTMLYTGYNGSETKQADVVLLAYPLGIVTDKEHISRDLEYYRKTVPPTGVPAMTEGIYSILYARLGDKEQAEHNFREAYVKNQYGPFRGIAECKGGHQPYFATGAGNALQAVIMGFGGYDITDGGVVKKHTEILPSGWKSMRIKRASDQ